MLLIMLLIAAGIRSAALWWIMSDSSSVEGGGVPEMLAKLRRGDESGSPRWERFAMRLIVGHLLAYNVSGLDKLNINHVSSYLCSSVTIVS